MTEPCRARLIAALFSAFIVPALCAAEVDVSGAPVYRPNAYSGNPGGYSPAWVCATSIDSPLRVHCNDLGYNPLEGWKEELQLSLNAGGVRHSYGLRHGLSRSECRTLKRQIQTLIKSGTEYCIVGDYAGASCSSGRVEESWVFYEIRTPMGSAADFEDWHRKAP
jgi:hypothetical protein